ncbi:putative Coatomer subunit epsilon-1 [Cocos nucifera]|uniref:Putative Coatomer subunit epsilon-1 n=1 Tax=Cocos nucifera TaxID=13894 RepID=A0A8K0N6H7_COCNU|nr:putative Coatomer subunit epsilon-1 [Cocos nucifera]
MGLRPLPPSLRNIFYLGAYQDAINKSDIPNLSSDDAVERNSLVYRSYIALSCYQVVISEIDSSASTTLQAVKLLAFYLAGDKVGFSGIRTEPDWTLF